MKNGGWQAKLREKARRPEIQNFKQKRTENHRKPHKKTHTVQAQNRRRSKCMQEFFLQPGS